MLSGHFENCYGLKLFDFPNINFSRCNKAMIYAPNGVMKSSLAKVFDDISKGIETSDRIFRNTVSSYSVTYYTSHYIFSSANASTDLSPTDRIYVIKTFTDSFEFTKETLGTLLADERTRNEYDVLMAQFSNEIRQIEDQLRILTGLTKPQIKDKIIADLDLASTADWPDIFEKIHGLIETRQVLDYLNDCTYLELFNDKVLAVYRNQDFINSIEEYIENLKGLLENNPILNNEFTDRNAETLGKELSKHNLFNAQHTIHLKDGTVIHSIDEWNAVVGQQLERIYAAPQLSKVFQKLKRLLTANENVSRLRDIIIAHREIIPALRDINALKIQTWLDCFSKLSIPFADYYDRISQYTAQIRSLYERAAEQSERWQTVVNEFNRRFRVPFEVQIENKANFLLRDEAPNLSFKYTREGTPQQSTTLKKDDLMGSLSTGEKRALYLLYILFDLERIRQQASVGGEKFLIIVDDIADSFDYKNKYAIIEYLYDLGNTPDIDLLILTHNFDFYRTVKKRLDINRSNCFIAQRDEEGIITITKFKYLNDFFKNVVINSIKDGNIDGDYKKKLLLSSIPFYRNLYQYTEMDNGPTSRYAKLTCFLHLKTTPLNTQYVKISDLWNLVNPFLNNIPFDGIDENYYSAIIRIANMCVADNSNEVLLENKLVIAIAIRLMAEKSMRNIITTNGQICVDANSNQTREWYKQANPFLTPEQKTIIEEVNLITPESIHLNSFMYEPLIDISDWALKELFTRVTGF